MTLLLSGNLFYFFLDGSKQRQKLRKKITAEKTNLQETLDKYNQLVTDGSAKLQDVENGISPWKAELTSEGVHRTNKRKRLLMTTKLQYFFPLLHFPQHILSGQKVWLLTNIWKAPAFKTRFNFLKKKWLD